MASAGQFHSQRIRSALVEWNARASAPGAANSSARPRALSPSLSESLGETGRAFLKKKAARV